MNLDAVLNRIDADLQRSTDRLFELLRIPSISTDPEYAVQCGTAANWLVDNLKSFGVEAEKRQTQGHPMVVGHIDGNGPHLLFYGHYDVHLLTRLTFGTVILSFLKSRTQTKGRLLEVAGRLMTKVN